MKLLIMQSSSASCHFIPLRSEYSLHHPVLKHPQSVLIPLVWQPMGLKWIVEYRRGPSERTNISAALNLNYTGRRCTSSWKQWQEQGFDCGPVVCSYWCMLSVPLWANTAR